MALTGTISRAAARRISREQTRAQNLKDYGRAAGPTRAQFVGAATRVLAAAAARRERGEA